VADAFDAMSSDRPYRSGMPAEKLNAIFRAECGKQWDPIVVSAFLAVRDAIDVIIEEDREQLSLDVGAWDARSVQ
jgi:HD-GYP domain-containing protein (c-di-GMP phosphodiesterase class II)